VAMSSLPKSFSACLYLPDKSLHNNRDEDISKAVICPVCT
jgi:hypothetical protein